MVSPVYHISLKIYVDALATSGLRLSLLDFSYFAMFRTSLAQDDEVRLLAERLCSQGRK